MFGVSQISFDSGSRGSIGLSPDVVKFARVSRSRKLTCVDSKQVNSRSRTKNRGARKANVTTDRANYLRRYDTRHPLLQARVSRELYDEARRRAASIDRSLSSFLDHWLEFTFAQHPMGRHR